MQHVPTPTAAELQRGGPRTTVDLLDIFWRRRTYLIVGTLIGLVLGVLYCELATPKFESTADVLVVQKRPQAVTGDNQFETGFEDYLATHLAVIASPLIVERAIANSDLGSLPSFADLEDPDEELADAIIGDLTVEGGSRELGESADSIMTLAFRSEVAEDCPLVVQALLDSYKSFHDEVWLSDNSVGLISEARDLLKNDLAQQEEAYSTFRQSSPLVAKGTDEVNPLQDRLTSIELQRSEILLRRTDVEWQLKAIEQAKQDGLSQQQLLAMVIERRQEATSEKGLSTVSTALENQLIQLVDDEQSLLEHYGPNHPHVLSLRQRIADTRRFLALPTTAHMTDPKSGDSSETEAPDTDPVAVYTQYLQQQLKELKISEDLLTNLYDHEHDAAKEHTIFQLKDESYRRGIERTETLYDVVVNRLQEASLVKDFGGFEARVIAPPRLGTMVSPNVAIILPAATFAGILLGCMLAVVIELRDGRFLSSGQIQQQLGLPVVGQIPQFASARRSRQRADNNVALDRMLSAYHEPRSMPAEAFRTLRNSLYFNSSGESPRVIQVSGSEVGDGASTVAANLAISLAQTGKRVLLIDTDVQKPRLNQMFGIDRPDAGLATIVTSDVEPADVICQTAIENLSLLPSGPLPNDNCELFTSPRFAELINLVRESYDHVLIDTEPLLVSSDPCVIATHTDGVVLTFRLNRNSRQRVKRAKQMLERQEVKILGVIVNRMSNADLRQHQLDRRDYAPIVHVEVAPRSRPEQTVGAAE